jgi:uncharacterized membrane protein YphA (DoxX/SURF4 family)
MSVILLAGRLWLVAVFAVAGIAKLFDLAGSRKSLADFGMPAWLYEAAGRDPAVSGTRVPRL